jgi:hypothetical protein
MFGNSYPEEIKRHSNEVKALARSFNAMYYSGIEDIETKFDIADDDIFEVMENSNVISGNIEGNEYCFVETYCRVSKYSYIWRVNIFLKIAKEIPDFIFERKGSEEKQLDNMFETTKLFAIPTFLFNLTLILAMFYSSSPIETSNLILAIITIIAMSLPGLFLISSYIVEKNKYKNRKKISINAEFDSFLDIYSNSDENSIKKIFNEDSLPIFYELFSDKYKINEHFSLLKSYNNCLHFRAIEEDKLSFELIKNHLDLFKKLIKLF